MGHEFCSHCNEAKWIQSLRLQHWAGNGSQPLRIVIVLFLFLLSAFTPRPPSCHVPSFSARHPMIPRLYVMPWKQDMKNQQLLKKNAELAGIPVLPHEETLCLWCRQRLCHRQDSGRCSASSARLGHTELLAPSSSHLSRYNSSAVTVRQLYQADEAPHSQ